MTRAKHILLIFILAFLCCFYVQKKTGCIEISPLTGAKQGPGRPPISAVKIFDSSFQEEMNTYVNDNIGFRPWLVRLFNGMRFVLFNMTSAPGVVIGKNGQFFIESYINNYTGINFVGKNKADEVTRKIKAVQDSLKAYNTDLIVVFAPGKASFYPEYIPDKYIMRKKDTTNYGYYCRQFTNAGINFIDFNSYFIKQKHRFAYPVYPECGTHWTSYGSALTLDSIIKYIQKKRSIHLPEFDYSSIRLSDSLCEREYDIGLLLNLPWKVPYHGMPYIRYKYNAAPEDIKPDVLAVGDSYWWCFVGDDIPSHVFKNDEYWFYNRDIYKHNVKQEQGVGEIDFGNETINKDVIILMATEATLDLFPYGFIDKAYAIFCLTKEEKNKFVADQINSSEQWKKDIRAKAKQNGISEKEQADRDVNYMVEKVYTPFKESSIVLDAVLREYGQKIETIPEWMEQVKKKAVENGISVSEQVKKDARYAYEMDYGSPEVKLALREIRYRIKSTPEWMVQISAKAKEKKISVEEMLELDVKFMYDQEHPKNP